MMHSVGSVAIQRPPVMRSLLDYPASDNCVTYLNLCVKCETSEKSVSPELSSISSNISFQTQLAMPIQTSIQNPLIQTPTTHRSQSNSPENLTPTPCKFYSNGFCKNGSSCRFVHESFPINLNNHNHQMPLFSSDVNNIQIRKKRKNEEVQICEHYLAGRCKFGRSCFKFHPPRTSRHHAIRGQNSGFYG